MDEREKKLTIVLLLLTHAASYLTLWADLVRLLNVVSYLWRHWMQRCYSACTAEFHSSLHWLQFCLSLGLPSRAAAGRPQSLSAGRGLLWPVCLLCVCLYVSYLLHNNRASWCLHSFWRTNEPHVISNLHDLPSFVNTQEMFNKMSGLYQGHQAAKRTTKHHKIN